MAAAAAIILRKERDIVNIYRAAGARDVASSRDPDELGIHQRVAFRLLIRHAVLREAMGGRYYLDEARWQALRSRRRAVALTVAVAMIVAVAVLVATGVVTLGALGASRGAQR